MFKKAKKISAAVLSAVMMLTAVATPLGISCRLSVTVRLLLQEQKLMGYTTVYLTA